MFQNYLKQALYQLREHRLISLITVLGTALAICMMMVIILVFQVRTKDAVPEVNRSRSLYVKYISVCKKGDSAGNYATGGMSAMTARECFKAMPTPEAVSVMTMPMRMRASAVVGPNISVDEKRTDEAFWQIFSFQFLSGKPYSKADFESGLAKVVLAESVARRLFGTVEAVGRTVLLNKAEYTVVGVVKDVSKLSTAAYAQVWFPYTSTAICQLAWKSGVMGMMRVVILARSAADFEAIRTEAERFRQVFNAKQPNVEVTYNGQPDNQLAFLYRKWNEELNIREVVIKFIVILTILLLVPAINLSGMTLSRTRKRLTEVGVRKAFGATTFDLLQQVFIENLILTLIAGTVGLLLSYGSVFVLNDYLFGNSGNVGLVGNATLSSDMLFSPLTFLIALMFCLLLNLLSAGLPAWRVSKMNVVEALNEK